MSSADKTKLDGLKTGSEITSQIETVEYSELSAYSTNMDANGIYANIEWKRKDGTTYMKSVLSGGTSPKYTTATVTYYDLLGTTVKKRLYGRLHMMQMIFHIKEW